MNPCDSIQRDLDAYRDNILQQDRADELQHHLQSCDICRTQLQQAEALERELRDVAAEWRPAPDLWARIKASVADESMPANKAKRLGSGLAATLLLGMLAVLAFNVVDPRQSPQSDQVAAALVNEFHTFVISRRELDYSDSRPDEIRNWFASKVDFRVPLPVSVAELNLSGGRLCNMFDQRIVSIMYKIGGDWLSLYVMKSKPGGLEQPPAQQDRLNGYTYLQWQQRGLHYFLVGDLPGENLQMLAQTFYASDRISRYFAPAQKPQPAPLTVFGT